MGKTITRAFAMAGLAAALVAATHSASATRAHVECHGVLRLDHGSIQIGGGAGEGEALCLVARSGQEKVLKGCSVGAFCRVGGYGGACKDSGECVEIRRVEQVRKR